jgi:hypothetical protein
LAASRPTRRSTFTWAAMRARPMRPAARSTPPAPATALAMAACASPSRQPGPTAARSSRASWRCWWRRATSASAPATDFDVTAPRPTVAPNPYVEINPASGGPGTQVTVRGGGYPGQPHDQPLPGRGGARQRRRRRDPIVTTSSDGNGNFSTAFTMPSHLARRQRHRHRQAGRAGRDERLRRAEQRHLRLLRDAAQSIDQPVADIGRCGDARHRGGRRLPRPTRQIAVFWRRWTPRPEAARCSNMSPARH